MMCYRCNVCQRTSKPGQPRFVHTIYRTRPGTVYQEIDREVPICEKCDKLLTDGVPFSTLIKQRGRPVRIPAGRPDFNKPSQRPAISFD